MSDVQKGLQGSQGRQQPAAPRAKTVKRNAFQSVGAPEGGRSKDSVDGCSGRQ